MTNNKFKHRNRCTPNKPAIDREPFTEEFVRAAEHDHFTKLVHALDPLVDACKSVRAQIKYPVLN